MKRRRPRAQSGDTGLQRRAAALVLLLLASVRGAATHAAPAVLTLRDDTARAVTLLGTPQRVVTLLPSLTETVCALGACDRLVAVDRYSNWPAEVLELPKAGGLDDAQVELIVSLKPDLVLLTRSQRIADRLRELNVNTFVIESRNYADVARTVTLIGDLLDCKPGAIALNAFIERDVQAIAERAHARRHGTGPSVYFEVDGAPYAAGPDSFIGELLTRLGARNIVTADLGPYPKLNPEYVVRHDPDVILISPAEAAQLRERPGWEHVRAVRENRLCTFSADVRDTLVRPGPRVPDGMRAIAECLERVAP